MRKHDILTSLCQIFCFGFFISCSNDTLPTTLFNWQLIAARDNGYSKDRPLLYRAYMPSHWQRKDPNKEESLTDTMKPVCEFSVTENDQTLRLTIHTFPFNDSSLRIPAQAQIKRWKGQFDELDELTANVVPQSHSGYHGLYFEGNGIWQGNQIKMMGWSMQLASCYVRQLGQEKTSLDRYKCADYTIKIVGPPELVERHRADLHRFAQSFELIEELPSPV